MNEAYRQQTELVRGDRYMGLFHILSANGVLGDGALFPDGTVTVVERMTGRNFHLGDMEDVWFKYGATDNGIEWIWARPKDHPSFRE